MSVTNHSFKPEEWLLYNMPASITDPEEALAEVTALLAKQGGGKPEGVRRSPGLFENPWIVRMPAVGGAKSLGPRKKWNMFNGWMPEARPVAKPKEDPNPAPPPQPEKLVAPPSQLSTSTAQVSLQAVPAILRPNVRAPRCHAQNHITLGPRKFKDTYSHGRTFSQERGPEYKGRCGELYANYVEITAWPETIYEYGINYGALDLGTDERGHKKSRSISKLCDKKAILETLSQNAPLQGKPWTTDYDTIWVLDKLWSHLDSNLEELHLGKVHFYRQDGRQETDSSPEVKLTYLRKLTLPNANSGFDLRVSHDSRERIIQALNAFVSRNVQTIDENSNSPVKRVGPNKFFSKAYYSELNDPFYNKPSSNHPVPLNLLAFRGFSTSVRPAAKHLLLGIAPLTSAAYRPLTVHDWIEALKQVNSSFTNDEEIYRSVIGLRCRLLHNRPTHADGDPDPNDERHRYRTITEFGRDLFAKTKEETDERTKAKRYVQVPMQWYQPRQRTDALPGTPMPTPKPVHDCFNDIINHQTERDVFQKAICVNVGARLKFDSKKHGRNEVNQFGSNTKNPVIRKEDLSMYDNPELAVWIPANLLEIEPYQVYMKELKPNHTKNMIEVAQVSPQVNRAWIEGEGLSFLGIQRGNKSTTASWMKNLNLAINGALLSVAFTKLESPTIMYGNNKQLTAETSDEFKEAGWNLRQTRFIQSAHVPAVCFIRICANDIRGAHKNRQTKRFGQILRKQFNLHGITSAYDGANHIEWDMHIGNAKSDRKNVESEITVNLENGFKRIMYQIYSNGAMPSTSRPNLPAEPETLFIIILPAKDPAHVFQSVKRNADLCGMRSICVLSDNVDGEKKLPKWKRDRGDHATPNPDEQYVSNLCLKINAKAAKDVHHIPHLHRAVMRETIVLGADIGVIKGAPEGCPAVAAVVGSVDGHHINMPGSMRLIPAKQDIIPFDAMVEMVVERFLAWAATHNRQLPKNILMYRDGVSQSQYPLLLQNADGTFADTGQKATQDNFKPDSRSTKKKPTPHDGEVPAIFAAYKEAARQLGFPIKEVPKLTFVVVGKRHNTRFFPKSELNMLKGNPKLWNGNVLPGTVVESGCTLPNEWPVRHNFFLQSHYALKGTGRPAHYVVLCDKIGLLDVADEKGHNMMHSITHAFCFAYTRATKGVSYCAPAYLADRLCARGQDYLKRIVHDLEDEPWWGKIPKPSEEDPNPAERWYKQIAQNVGEHEYWRFPEHGGEEERKNPWHPALEGTMFWV